MKAVDHDSFIFFHDWARNYFYDLSYDQIGRLIFAICDSRINGTQPAEDVLNDQVLRLLYRTIKTTLEMNDLKYIETTIKKSVAAHMKAFKAKYPGLTAEQYDTEMDRFRMQIDAELCKNLQKPAELCGTLQMPTEKGVTVTENENDTETEKETVSVSERDARGNIFRHNSLLETNAPFLY